MVGGVGLKWRRDRGSMAAATDNVPDQDPTPEIDNDLTEETMMMMLLDRFLEKILLIREIEEEGRGLDLLERKEMIGDEIGLIADLMNGGIENLRESGGVDLLVMIPGI